MSRTVDLVADIGESFGSHRISDDERLLSTLTSANVPCGFHVGPPWTLAASDFACRTIGISIGAHPQFPGPRLLRSAGIGAIPRRTEHDVLYQIGALQTSAIVRETSVTHVSPRGRLGTLASTDRYCESAVVNAVEEHDADLPALTIPGELDREARARGLRVSNHSA